MKLLVRNLSRDTTESTISKIFKTQGDVKECTLVLDQKTGISKGFAFVEMPDVKEAKAAIKKINGKMVDESKIRVKESEPKLEKNTSKGSHINESQNSYKSRTDFTSIKPGGPSKKNQANSLTPLKRNKKTGRAN